MTSRHGERRRHSPGQGIDEVNQDHERNEPPRPLQRSINVPVSPTALSNLWKGFPEKRVLTSCQGLPCSIILPSAVRYFLPILGETLGYTFTNPFSFSSAAENGPFFFWFL
jgi:hypothetical protein